jgi:hypothetical protein
MGPKKHLSFTALRKKMSVIFRAIPDGRQSNKTKVNIHDALMSGFACMHFQEPSLLQFQTNLQEAHHKNNLKTLFDVEEIPKETQMREIIDGVDSEYFREVFKNYYLRLQRGKHLESYQLLNGLYYFPMDGSQFFSSEDIHCEQCLTRKHRDGRIGYSHQVLQGGLMHPDQSAVIPFMPEPISNEDGQDKQDCEMNAAKRYIKKVCAAHPQLGLIIGGDSLFSRQPLIEEILGENAHYLFTAKPEDHKYLWEWIGAYPKLNEYSHSDKEGYTHFYEWMNEVPLNGREDSILVNFFRYRMMYKDKKSGVEKIVYKSSWVTDLMISDGNIKVLVKTGRCRWKAENEVFNVMKNHGYYMDRNYGHGKENLSYNFYLLTLLAFFFHQIFELTDRQYQACRKKFGSKKHLWEKLRAYIEILIFETWEALLDFAVSPKEGLVTWAHAP